MEYVCVVEIYEFWVRFLAQPLQIGIKAATDLGMVETRSKSNEEHLKRLDNEIADLGVVFKTNDQLRKPFVLDRIGWSSCWVK